MGDKDTTPMGVVRGKMEWDDWGKGRGQRKEPPPAANKKRWNEKGGTHTPVCAWPRVWCLIRVCVTESHPTVRARAFLFLSFSSRRSRRHARHRPQQRRRLPEHRPDLGHNVSHRRPVQRIRRPTPPHKVGKIRRRIGRHVGARVCVDYAPHDLTNRQTQEWLGRGEGRGG